MQLSQRINGIVGQGSDGWGIFYRARALKAQGRDIVELTIGEHDVRTDPAILEAMHQSAMAGDTGYALVPGLHELRTTVAERVQDRTGVPTCLENVMITPGGQSGLFAAHMAVCDPGDIATYVDPNYATYPTTLRAVGAKAHAIAVSADNGFEPRLTDLETAPIGAKTLLINSPNNPTGSVYSEQTMHTIAAFCQSRDMVLISDEVYDTQIWQGRHVSPRSLPNMGDRTIVIGSLSKSHAMTGSRIGWVVAPAEAIEKMIDLATNTTYGVATFIQRAGLAAFALGDDFEHKIAAPFLRRRNLAMDILKRYPNIGFVPPNGAMYMMLDLRKTGLSGEEFALKLLDEQGIAVMPGESFGNAAAGHIRVALTVADDQFVDAFERLCQFGTGLMHG